MDPQDSRAEIFDVFLCHNSADKPAVREIALELSKKGINPWLDVDQIRPGTSWQTTLGEQIESINSAAVFVSDAGLGPWQNQESQALLNQFVKRGCPVIPVVLPSAKTAPDLPWMFANLHCIDFRTDSQPLERLIWGITGQKPAELASVPVFSKPPTMQETAAHLITGGNEEARSNDVASEARLYPPLAEPPDRDNAAQLNILRKRVSEYWVDGVLNHSVYNEVLISLEKRQVDKNVDAPWKYTVEVAGIADTTPLDNREVSVIYDATGLLLILGEPGSGKTTTLLDLARTLLDRARDDIRERVPVVVNLSSRKTKQPLAEWISNELSEKYRVPRKIARFWLQQGYLLPLLDGLDEVELSMQPDCVTAINAFIEEFNPSGLAVCCRLNEYRWLPKRLKLNGAICIEPLSSDEVSRYLTAAGSKLAALREAVHADPVLQELAQTPLMLSIMSLAHQGTGSDDWVGQKGSAPEERRKQIFGIYVKQMFQRKGTISPVCAEEKVIDWLSWLAGEMKKHSQSVFLVEGLQPNSLGTRAKRAAYGIVVAISLGLLFCLFFGLFGLMGGLETALSDGLSVGLSILLGVGLACWSASPTKNGIISGLIGGLIIGLIMGLRNQPTSQSGELITDLAGGLLFGLLSGMVGGIGVGSLTRINLVETISWNWNEFWRRTVPGLIAGLIVGLILALMAGLGSGLRFNLNGGLLFVSMVGLPSGFIGGLISGLVGGFADRVKVGKASPNQGIKLSLENSLAPFFVTWLIFVVIGLLLQGLTISLFHMGPLIGAPRVDWPLIGASIIGLMVAPAVSLLVALNRGGSAVIKHYALRLILWLDGYTPLNLVKFLDHCAKLIFLKKVGGGYIFVHRMLLDYFADLPQSTKRGDGKVESARS